jgi:hypothetical protein
MYTKKQVWQSSMCGLDLFSLVHLYISQKSTVTLKIYFLVFGYALVKLFMFNYQFRKLDYQFTQYLLRELLLIHREVTVSTLRTFGTTKSTTKYFVNVYLLFLRDVFIRHIDK